MRISFLPQRRDDALEVHKQGDILTINDEAYDFSILRDGDDLPEAAFIGTDFIDGPVMRIGGAVHLTLRLPYLRGNRHVDAPPDLVDPPDGALMLPDLDQENADAN